MMVGDDHVKAKLAGPRHFVYGSNRAVNRDQEGCRPGREPFDVFESKPITVLATAWDKPINAAPKLPQRPYEDRR
jgi:hypothetical protein